ncbi:hypothetical protein DLH72_01285 [Candidatus Gracilibacteria bacterium]|nr:MAG: hypothetical protein DLH72_01285 [Candidatus Gracilibacteria bacterium]
MIEIKFKAFHKYLGKMLIPERLYIDDGVVTAFDIKGEEYVYQVKVKTDGIGLELMQYTGLKDKNGKEIYEGDILQIGLRKYEVIWEDGFYRLFDRKAEAKEKYCSLNLKDLKIIGNIYENPELIG